MRGPYVLRVDGVDYVPSEFGALRDHRGREIGNPDQLFRDAQLAAMRVAAEFEQEVEIVGREGRGGEKEVVASRVGVHREGDYVLVDLAGSRSFSQVSYRRPI